jgi:hypothetical protein
VRSLLYAVILAVGSPALAQHAHGHQVAPVEPAASARRWDTDAPLRAGMGRIRVSVDALGHHEHGHLDPAQVAALATRIEEDVAYLVANCRLEPQADIALHGIISRLMQGVGMLRTDPANPVAITSMRQALQDYRQHFDDPSWPLPDTPKQPR